MNKINLKRNKTLKLIPIWFYTNLFCMYLTQCLLNYPPQIPSLNQNNPTNPPNTTLIPTLLKTTTNPPETPNTAGASDFAGAGAGTPPDSGVSPFGDSDGGVPGDGDGIAGDGIGVLFLTAKTTIMIF